MTFKFEAPIKMPRFTREGFIRKKQEYVAEHGYTVHIPGFSDIFTWNVTPEPTEDELFLYRNKQVKVLGEKRFYDIKALMAKKRENYLRILSSPTPQIVQNAVSVLTTLDDVNDVLGTIAVVARIVARRLPATAAKFLLGPAGWALMGADIAGLGLKLSSLPFKVHRLQHELNDLVKGNPLSKKAKLRRINKLKRLRLSKGELIEALQTTDNMFGVGISLGGIMGMLYEIPAGLYRHVQGKKVTITGLPAPLLWFDRQWSRMLKGAVNLFYGPVDLPDQELNKAIVATNLASRAAHSYLDGISPFDAIEDLENTELLPAMPTHPLTIQVINEETPEFLKYVGWISDSAMWKTPTKHFDETIDHVQDGVKNWIQRNKNSMEGMVAAQNMVDVGPNILAAIEGDDQLEMSYDPIAQSLLELMNVNLRFPFDLSQSDVLCWSDNLSREYQLTGGVSPATSQEIAKTKCGFEFTTFLPQRATPSEQELLEKKKHNIDGLRRWHFAQVRIFYFRWLYQVEHGVDVSWLDFLNRVENHQLWLQKYGFVEGEPLAWLSLLNEAQLERYNEFNSYVLNTYF